MLSVLLLSDGLSYCCLTGASSFYDEITATRSD